MTQEEREKLVSKWEAIKREIVKTGNHLNSERPPQPFFKTGGRFGYTEQEMLDYCDRMIKSIKDDQD